VWEYAAPTTILGSLLDDGVFLVGVLLDRQNGEVDLDKSELGAQIAS